MLFNFLLDISCFAELLGVWEDEKRPSAHSFLANILFFLYVFLPR